jgi:UDP-N-acetylglucosamine 2-epimerase (non-hydrolysing)/GDP/UDP-N,N'-diacetylbacillosamine 2-epimerase (hydrolysing)
MKPSGRSGRRRRIAVVTGTRAEYGLLRSTLEAIRAHRRLELQLVVTGMHLLRKFGHTVDDVVGDGWRIDARVRMQVGSDDPTDQAIGLSRGIAGIARFLERADADVVVVLGDRVEAMAGALAAVTTGRVLAHIHGGDVAPGDFDDTLRHAITKLAHVHFVATPKSLRRVLRLGETPEHVHLVGAPGLDRLAQLITASHRRAGSRGRDHLCPPTALVVQHPCGRTAVVERRVMEDVLRAVRSTGLRQVIVYPNSDRGHRGIIQAIERHASANGDGVQPVRSLPHDDYLRALLRADVLVGNSSSGIIEAPFAGTPSVDVGDRQAGREPGGACVIHADESLSSISAALRRALKKRPRSGAPRVYGDGRAGERIARLLATLQLTPRLTRKRLAF